MAADSGIFEQYLKPPRSVADYRADADKQEQNALTLAASRVTNQTAQQTADDAKTMRQLAIDNGGDQNAIIKAANAAGLTKQALEMQKSLYDTQKTQADTGLSNAHAGNFKAQTATSDYDLKVKQADQSIKDISSFSTAQDAAAHLNAAVAAGSIPAEKAQSIMQGMPQDPAQFPAWQIKTLRGVMSAKDQMAQISPDANARLTAETSRTNNDNTNATSRSNNAATVGASRANNRDNIAKDMAVNGMTPGGVPTDDVNAMAKAIATGQLAPINGFALARPRGQQIMARVMELNPTYDAGDYAAKNSALKGFSTGKEGTALRSFNVASDHLETLGTMADALNNKDTRVLNTIGNAWAKQTGGTAPTNFDAVKEIVSKEVVKAIVAGGGGVGEREEISKLMDKANSPAQLKGVITHFKELMDAQRSGLMDQYQRTTGRTDGETQFAPSKRTSAGSSSALHSQADAILRGK
jgi:hypothetical protein